VRGTRGVSARRVSRVLDRLFVAAEKSRLPEAESTLVLIERATAPSVRRNRRFPTYSCSRTRRRTPHNLDPRGARSIQGSRSR
jgi:hypothetical protein